MDVLHGIFINLRYGTLILPCKNTFATSSSYSASLPNSHGEFTLNCDSRIARTQITVPIDRAHSTAGL